MRTNRKGRPDCYQIQWKRNLIIDQREDIGRGRDFWESGLDPQPIEERGEGGGARSHQPTGTAWAKRLV